VNPFTLAAILVVIAVTAASTALDV